MKVAVYNQKNEKVEDIELKDSVFGIEVNIPLMHQVVTAKLASDRSGTASTKTRKDISGSTAKEFRQKGTGRARQGSGKAPHFTGGGTAFGPKPRDFSQKVNKKMFKKALSSALSDRVASNSVYVIEDLKMEVPRTKQISELMKKFKVNNCLFVDNSNEELALSVRNIYKSDVVSPAELHPYDILRYDNLFITKSALEKVTVLGEL